ncbi:MAG: hypothetical protein K5925_04860 [Bacilli bacterium]|nr:hypothetical protein [Bacilli bacterium]
MNKKLLLIGVAPLLLNLAACNQDNSIKFDYIFTAQPVVAATNSEIFKNVQEDFKTKYSIKLTQASIFVKNGADADSVNAFLAKVAADITAGVAVPATIKAGIELAGSVQEQQNKYGVPGAMAMKVTAANNGFSLGYEVASTIKSDITSFVKILTNNAISELSDDVFYTPGVPSEEASYSNLKILAPTGAPSIALYNFATNSNFTTTSNPQEGLIPMFDTDTYDVIIAPTQGGLTKIVKQNRAYKIAATITFGNFYIVSTGRDEDKTLNEGDKVLIFQENDVPGKVFKATYGDLNLDLTAVAAVSDTRLVIENDGILKK